MSETILVTGGAGYVGSHAAKALAAAGFLPVTLDDLSRGHRDAVRWGPLETVSLLDTSAVTEVLARHRPAAVMHFAALAYVGESVVDPAPYWRVNVGGSLSLLEAMRATGVSALVFSSTCATFGLPEQLPIAADAPQRPINPYGATKLAVERMLADCEVAYGIRSVALRYFNAAGADPEGEIGEDHDPETHLIPLAIASALGTGPQLTINGDDWPTPDGTCVRDYIHVTDLADAHVRALRHLLAGGASARVNLGTGQGTSIREILSAVEQATGRPVPYQMGPRRPGDPPVLVADPTAAREVLGWQPVHSAAIVPTAVAWARRPR
ncbi:MAG: UDP-glucose 4-epimerase GalE [Alphaproteobacteria bacterium]|nr:UDP-glucose 4-epimerase GalE [Alphaproteobacteria bacterium]